jgi:hypothetical protein
MPVQIKLRRDTAANWLSVNPVLATGEPGLETDTRKVKYGNGVDTWSALQYGVTQADANALTGNTLSATVVNSSLTSVGILTDLTVSNTIKGSINGNAGTVNNGFYQNSSIYIGSTAVAANRASGTLYLQGVSIDGNAATSNKFSSTVQINGVAFDGSQAITITAAAGTLTGTTLKSTVVTSSLTSVGVLTSLSSTGNLVTTSIDDNSNNFASGALQIQNGGAAIKGRVKIGGAVVMDSTLQTADLLTASAGISVLGNANITGKLTVGGSNIKSFAVAMAIGLS